jgi:hypothetical protein
MPGHIAGLQRVTIALAQTPAANHSSVHQAALTITLGSPATAGNCLVACIGAWQGSTVAAVTSSASPDHWALGSSGDLGSGTAEIWADPGCAGGNTTVGVTFTVPGLLAVQVFEFSGVAHSSAVDTTASGGSLAPGTSWTTGASGSAAAGDLLLGMCLAYSTGGAFTLAGPSSPWVNEPQIATSQSGEYVRLLAGYQTSGGAGAFTYAGNSGLISQQYAAAGLALKPSGGGGSGPAGSFLPFFT